MKFLRWFLINFIFLAIIWIGIALDFEPVRNLVTFLFWLFLLFSFVFIAGAKTEPLRTTLAKGPGVPRWLDVSYDILVVGILVWFGYFVLGSVYLFSIVLQFSAHVAAKESLEESSEQAT